MQISQKKERKRMQCSFYKVKQELIVLFSIYIYINISIYIYIYLYIFIYILKKRMRVGHAFFQKNATFCVLLGSFTFLAKEPCVLCVLLHSLQKNVRSLRSFMFLRKEPKIMHCSFGSHKSPKTWKKNVKECCVLLKNAKTMPS